MALNIQIPLHTRCLAAVALLPAAIVLAYLFRTQDATIEARVVGGVTARETPWRTYDPPEIMSGVTIPPDTHVILHLPIEIKRISRRTLFGPEGKNVRYWGYCFAEGKPDAARAPGFPGEIFLSEAERAVREDARLRTFPAFGIRNPPTSEQLKQRATEPDGRIRHQKEIFFGGTACYVMSAAPLPVGADMDNDQLNSELEAIHGTDPWNDDTDGDGISDGVEVQSGRTDPTLRDSDSDSLIDGIEDADRDGRPDAGETDPAVKDTDRDGLCDGYCRLSIGGRICSTFSTTKNCIPELNILWKGEDKNLNGIVDKSETDPRKTDSDDDGILDDQEFYNCLLEKKTDC